MCPPAAGEEPGATTQPPDRSQDTPNRAFAAGPRRRRTRLWLGIAIVVVLAGIGIGAFAFLRSGGTITATPPFIKPSQSTSPRTAFAFQLTSVRAVTLGTRKAKQQANDAAGTIAQSLSQFYDQAFADPKSWSSGVPDDAWTIFGDTIRDEAKSDAGSFTPATQGVELASLDVTKSTLDVQVLFDPAGHPQGAFAAVVFEATGDLKNGQQVLVDNVVTFFFEPVSGHWVVVGYPTAKTSVDAGTSSTPPSASPGSSASPTAGGSP